MARYVTETFELNNDDVLWEKFMCFMRAIIPYEETVLNKLSEIQKKAAVAFIYASEVMGEGHIGFWDLHGKYINHSTIIAALKEISVSDKFIKIIEDMSKDFTPVAEIADRCCSEEDFEMVMEQIGEIYDEFDNRFYQYGDEEIIDKLIIYIRRYHLEFFEYI